MSPVSVMSFTFKCHAVPVSHFSPFPSPGKRPELVLHIFRSPALMKELHSARRKGEHREIEWWQGAFRAAASPLMWLLASLADGCCVPMSFLHVNYVIMHITEGRMTFHAVWHVLRRVDGGDYATPASWNWQGWFFMYSVWYVRADCGTWSAF